MWQWLIYRYKPLCLAGRAYIQTIYREFSVQRILILAAMLFGVTAAGPSLAKLSITETNKYYVVRGKTPEAVFNQIRRKGPRIDGRKRVVAVTDIRLKYSHLEVAVRGKRCTLVSVRIVLALTYKYPKWRNIKRSSPQAQKNWRAYYSEIVRHEKRHGDIAKKFARQIDRSFRKTTSRSSNQCAALAQKLKRKFARLSRQHDRKQTSFDRHDNRRNSVVMRRALDFAKFR